jgi:Fe-S-cluster containining protein
MSQQESGNQAKYKLVREGVCTNCGKCCLSVSLALYSDPTRQDDKERVDDYCKWLDYHNVTYKRNPTTVELIMGGQCKYLEFIDGKSKCIIYNDRPLVCKEFPNFKNETCPGFTFREEIIDDKPIEAAVQKEKATEGKSNDDKPDVLLQKEGGAEKSLNKVPEVQKGKLQHK